jgi:hypothetical protein
MSRTSSQEGLSSCCDGKSGATKDPYQLDLTDAELAKELNELTALEREKVWNDIHGVPEARNETPEFLDTCLKDIDKALSEIPRTRRSTLDRAFLFKPSLERDVKFKLMFLRAESYDAKKAANRMEKYFVHKVELFGEEKLVKNITLDDLDQKCMKVLGAGTMFELPHTDQTGRPIVYFDVGKFDVNDQTTMVRSQ